MDIITSTYLLNTFFMLVILLMVWLRCPFGIRQPKSLRRCRGLIEATAAYVVMDAAFIVCHLTESLHGTPFYIATFFFYISYVILPFMWHRFLRNYIGLTIPTDLKREYVPMVFLLCLVVATPFTGALWSLDDAGMYVRGPLYSIYAICNYFYYIDPVLYAIVTMARGNSKKEPFLFQSMAISLVPIVGAVVNNYVLPIYEVYPFQPFCSIVVALLAYFFMAARESDILQAQQEKAIADALAAAQEASRVKTTFLSNMSHDIRTPMNAIINLTQLAETEDDINVVRDYLSKMEVSGKFLLGLINDILDMSRIESGEVTLHKENLTRTEFLNTVDTVIGPLMEARHINFHPELNPGEYTISVDKLRFNQIFFNLLSNAAKFTPEGGDVWFEVTNLEVEEGNKLKIKFVVRDNGIGMSEEFMKHLFEPFAREQSQLTHQTQGTGLGLPIVKSLVDAMGGTIDVKSKLGEGSEFTVIFDVDIVAKEELHDTAAVETKKTGIKGMKVLLVEDNEINTFVAKIILENAGCVVTTAENGKIAVETFDSSAPFEFSAILMDIRMPVMDGFEATRKIRELDREDAKTVPIIAMTADAFDEERKRTLEAGMDYHLAKPIDAKLVCDVLEKCVHKSNGIKCSDN